MTTKTKKTRLTTTLALLRQYGACADGFRKLLGHVGLDYPRDAPINLLTVLDSNGLDDTLWCLYATEQNSDKLARLFAADCAEAVLYLFERERPGDMRPRQAIEAARAFARGEIDGSTRAAAEAAAWAADEARDAAWSAARDAAGDAAGAAARVAARAAARDAQITMLRAYLMPDRAPRKPRVKVEA